LAGGSGVRDAMDVMMADDDHVYVPLSVSVPLSSIDGAPGDILRTYEQVVPFQLVVLVNKTLLISSRGKLCTVRAKTGQFLWETSGSHACTTEDKVLIIDRKGTTIAAVGLETGDIATVKWPKCHSQNLYNQTTTREANIYPFPKNLNLISVYL